MSQIFWIFKKIVTLVLGANRDFQFCKISQHIMKSYRTYNKLSTQCA
jgi:hypothetical protein